MTDLRRSYRTKRSKSVVEENTIDDPIDADLENSNDDFEDQVQPNQGSPASVASPMRWRRSMILGRVGSSSPDEKVEAGKKGRKRTTDNVVRKPVKKPKVGVINEADVAGPSKVVPEVKSPKIDTKGKKPAVDISTTLRTRSSPRPFYLAIATLKPNQQACIDRLGFGSLLEFKVDGIPAKLGFYVVKNFDDEKMEIKLSKGTLRVDCERISQMLGLKNEGDNILNAEVSDNGVMIEEWKNQYQCEESKITPTVVRKMIRSSKVVDLNFKLNFIVLFANVIGSCSKTGCCDLEVLKHISPNTDFSRINWCQFLLDNLPNCKDGWKPKVKNNYFCGPLTLLTMIYVDGTKCESLPIARKRPPTSKWSMDLLQERETAEVDTGGCGLGELEAPYEEEEDDGFPEDLEGFVWKLGKYIETIRKAGSCFEKNICLGLVVFPDSDELKALELKYMEVLRNLDKVNHVKDVNREETSGGIGQKENVEAATPNVTVGSGNVSGGGWFDTPEATLGMQTQALVVATVDKISNEYRKGKGVALDDMPSFSLNLTPSYEELKAEAGKKRTANKAKAVAAVPVSFARPNVPEQGLVRQRGKREQLLTAQMKSPFCVRAVDFSPLDAQEKKVCKLLFEMSGNPDDILFSTRTGHSSTRLMLESLGQSQHVVPNVINAWAEILNVGERTRGPNSPLRYYLPTFMVTERFRDVLYNADERIKLFSAYVDKALAKDGKAKTFKGIDLVFIPVSNGEHNFLVIFNLKKGGVWMLDSKGVKNVSSKKSKKTTPARQIVDGEETVQDDSMAIIVHADFGRYLTEAGHPKAVDIFTIQMQIPILNWRTESKVPNSGVVVMRHMETYMGEPMERYDCGLSSDARKQIAQINKLRSKYVAKLLLGGWNLKRDNVVGMIGGI